MDAVKEQFRLADKFGAGKISEDALAELIWKLCGDAIPREVIQALFQSFDGTPGSRENGSINYNEFIEWLFQSLGGGANDSLRPSNNVNGYRLFCSHQHTAEAIRRRAEWLPGGTCHSVKASTPPFNIRLGEDSAPLPTGCVSLNIATFGVRLPRVIMDLFESREISNLSEQLKIPLPRYTLDSFVQKKMPKVMDLVTEARKGNLDEKNLAAVAKLEKFLTDFQNINTDKGDSIQGPDAWEAFVAKRVPEGWQDQLHFDNLLTKNFGFDESVSAALRTQEITIPDKDKWETVTLEHHSLRWLGKAFRGYGPVGCLTDVVNLVYAMLGMKQPDKASEEDAIAVFNKFQEKLNSKNMSDVWIPTHLVHDAESDDSLSWLLLEHVHRLMNTKLEVLIQLPADEKSDAVVDYLRKHVLNAQVFRDTDSSNGKAVVSTWGGLAAASKG